MLERYFVKPETIDRIRASWIAESIEGYVCWMAEHGYAARNVFRRVPVLVQFGAFAAGRGATQVDELPTHVDAFVAEWLRTHGGQPRLPTHRKVACFARSAVEQMLRVGLPDLVLRRRRAYLSDPFITQAPGFFPYLREERGLRKESIEQYRHFLRGFEGYLHGVGCHTLGELSPLLLSAFVTERAGTFGRSTMTGLCSSLRVFLRYLRRESVISRDLARSVEQPQAYRLAELPRSISWDSVRRMLEAVNRRAPIGRRDYAILLLLVTYGLRGGEVASLTLEDVDWKHERLHIRERKADHIAVYPLSPLVGEAIVAYLKHGRPQTKQRQLFLRCQAPYVPLTHQAVSQCASRYLRKAGVSVRRAGSHTLRHTCVQRLADSGFPLKTIGDYVGHRSASSTEIYAKVAVETLRDIALGDGEALP